MKRFQIVTLVSTLLIVILNFQAFGQSYGIIIEKSEADELFGIVLHENRITIAEMESILSKTENFIMFYQNEEEIIIKGDGGKIIYSNTSEKSDDLIFSNFSKNLLSELLLSANEDYISLESRINVFSISTSRFTLEFSMPCPPDCE